MVVGLDGDWAPFVRGKVQNAIKDNGEAPTCSRNGSGTLGGGRAVDIVPIE